jgi:alkylresorcinol/alkylpyrone synthase
MDRLATARARFARVRVGWGDRSDMAHGRAIHARGAPLVGESAAGSPSAVARPASARPAGAAGAWVIATATAVPGHVLTQEQAWERFSRLLPDDRSRRVAQNIFERSGVTRRFVTRPVEEYLEPRSFGERNRRYQTDALDLARAACLECLARAGAGTARVEHLIFATTTGLSTPSLDATLAQQLGLPARVQRLPLFGLGCAGGAASLARAAALLAGRPHAMALVVCVELCGHCFDPADRSPLAAVATSLFGDGAAAVLVGGAGAVVAGGDRHASPAAVPPPVLARVVDTEARLLPGTQHIMGWEFEERGFRLVLSRELPALLAREARAPVGDLLDRNGLSLEDVRFLIIHPGGPRVLDSVEAGLDLPAGSLAVSRSVMAAVGNLSSASVLFVLDHVLRHERPACGDFGLVLAPGPGFGFEAALLSFSRGRPLDAAPSGAGGAAAPSGRDRHGAGGAAASSGRDRHGAEGAAASSGRDREPA